MPNKTLSIFYAKQQNTQKRGTLLADYKFLEVGLKFSDQQTQFKISEIFL